MSTGSSPPPGATPPCLCIPRDPVSSQILEHAQPSQHPLLHSCDLDEWKTGVGTIPVSDVGLITTTLWPLEKRVRHEEKVPERLGGVLSLFTPPVGSG